MKLSTAGMQLDKISSSINITKLLVTFIDSEGLEGINKMISV